MRLRFRTTRNCCPLIGDVPFEEWESGGVCWLLEVGMAVSGAIGITLALIVEVSVGLVSDPPRAAE